MKKTLFLIASALAVSTTADERKGEYAIDSQGNKVFAGQLIQSTQSMGCHGLFLVSRIENNVVYISSESEIVSISKQELTGSFWVSKEDCDTTLFKRL